MYTLVDLGMAFLVGIFATLVAITVYYGGQPPHPRG
jgi:hypothetical protein